jgi:2'-5' RNA ligase
MALPTFQPGQDISATGGSQAYSTGMAASYAATRDVLPGQPQGRFDEMGFPGVLSFGQFIQQAYQRELYWPGVFPLYNRLRRSDPEVTVIRQIFAAVAGDLKFEWIGPEEGATSDDARALEFAESALLDLDGGIEQFRDTLVSYVPFMGWGWWEAVPGLRRKNWAPPDKEGEPDEWRSKFDDGLTGFRRLAFRDHSSFQGWDISPATGKLRGLRQMAMPHPYRILPLNRSVHITFGDTANPEGLTPLEGLWRLERIKYGLEIVQGIGYEHAAGYLNVTKTTEGEITPTDKANIRQAARAVLSAQEGNYAAWPNGFTGKVEDVPFAAGVGLMESIRYYGLLKLALFNAQWVGMSSITDKGSYSALHDASSTWMVFFNAMMSGFAHQLDLQLGQRLFDQNKNAFPGMTERPHLTITPVEKFIELDKLGTFWAAIKDSMPLGDDDYLSFRRKSGFLPEVLPDPEEVAEPETPDDTSSVDEAEQDAMGDIDNPAVAGLSLRFLKQGQTPTAAIVALFLPPAIAKALAVKGGEAAESLHLTLAYLGPAADLDADQRKRLKEIVRSFAALHAPLSGRITGSGSFEGDGETAPCVALVDVPGLPEWRERLIDILKRNGFAPAGEHGFIPHITLKYTTGGEQVTVTPRDINFDMVTAAIAGRRSAFPLRGSNTRELTIANLQNAYGAQAAGLRSAVYDAVLEYLISSSPNSRGLKSAVGRSVLETYPDVFYAAYRAGGAEEVDADDDAWLTARENAELANVGMLFQSLKAIRDEHLPPADLVAEANLRADGYADALRGVYSAGLLMGQKNKMLTMVGVDGVVSCPWCQRNKGQRFSARKWLRIGIPGVPGNGSDCGAWHCRHGLQDDNGVMWTLVS